STRLGLPGMPAAAESVCVARDVQVAELTGARLHIAHLSAKASLAQVRIAKRSGLRVTCEGTPHHFTLIDEDVAYNSRSKMNPPLAAREDRQALWEGLADGTIDAIATDHAPHEPALKDVEFDKAAFGILGFETAVALALDELVHTGRISVMRLVELFTTGPARVLGKDRRIAIGDPGDLTIFALDRPWTYQVERSASKSRNSPFAGRNFKEGPVATIVAGKIADEVCRSLPAACFPRTASSSAAPSSGGRGGGGSGGGGDGGAVEGRERVNRELASNLVSSVLRFFAPGKGLLAA